MACHEVAALRLGLMKVLGIEDEAERQHELAELGAAASELGPIRALSEANDFARLRRMFEASLARLDEKVAKTPADDPKLPYYRSLVVLTKKVEMDLRNQAESLHRFYRDLEEMHDFVHEIYPAE
jgi:hypothetical protein